MSLCVQQSTHSCTISVAAKGNLSQQQRFHINHISTVQTNKDQIMNFIIMTEQSYLNHNCYSFRILKPFNYCAFSSRVIGKGGRDTQAKQEYHLMFLLQVLSRSLMQTSSPKECLAQILQTQFPCHLILVSAFFL